jgi:hypothetical protein
LPWIEFYKTAAQTHFAVFVVVDYGDGGNKIAEIKSLRE